jgi:hypothetical protein
MFACTQGCDRIDLEMSDRRARCVRLTVVDIADDRDEAGVVGKVKQGPDLFALKSGL